MASGGINFANIRPVQPAASKPINFANIKPVAPVAAQGSFDLTGSVEPLLHALEGNSLTANVPAVAGGQNSGVTIAGGLDLGQFSEADLRDNLKLSPALVKRLSPYTGKKGKAASAALKNLGSLSVSKQEASEINKSIIADETRRLEKNFKDAIGTNFKDEPVNVQQAILIASFNLGSSTKGKSLFTSSSGKRTNFAKQIKAKDYKGAGANLSTWTRNAAPGLQKRRMTEGDLLSGTIDSTKFVNQLNVNLSKARGGP